MLSKLPRKLSGLAGAMVLCIFAFNAPARADAPGCKDPLGLKRFAGAVIAGCEARDFDEVVMPTGALKSWNYDRNKGEFESQLDLEGRRTSTIYILPEKISSPQAYRNWQQDLEASGFKFQMQARGLDLGGDQGRIFENRGGAQQLFGYAPENARYGIAVKEDGGHKIYAMIYVVEYKMGVHSAIEVPPGRTITYLETLETGALQNQMKLVTASEMVRSIQSSGRATLYGILFDFNKADIKPDSAPALQEIAKFLTENPARNLHVVGHTDGIGGLETNLALSQARANAVVTALVRTYGIAQSRLKASGVGLLAPVAPNDTDEGRAKNRRVELVPM